ncbi:MAG TPA: hypothetical protein VIY71_08655 [Solirubrobacterales bacterium]
MTSSRTDAVLIKARAWLVTGPLGRGLAFAIDFVIAVRTGVRQRRG